ncbi:hypothetical protein GCM10009860_01080 [Microbacterium mitrae]|uniref:PH domain-containing protein n=1 Tax=Microbacterium mitrae TaxID=664640 RepID=A0A5C8HQD2_9MICO|nr:hypothetical protein [Microbacterium mitrae]TXK05532.1 hypothetical protein FVP60_00575 [Microbacterium mitrae]
MTRELAIGITIGVGVLILAGMAWGWRRRSRRDSALQAPVGELGGDVVGSFSGLYVATTEHDEPLNRLAIRHLAFRSKVTATVTTEGINLVMPGSPTIGLAKASLIGAGRATWTIDRVVEKDGLVFISWQVNDTTVADSYLRLQESNPTSFLEALDRVLPNTTATGI